MTKQTKASMDELIRRSGETSKIFLELANLMVQFRKEADSIAQELLRSTTSDQLRQEINNVGLEASMISPYIGMYPYLFFLTFFISVGEVRQYPPGIHLL